MSFVYLGLGLVAGSILVLEVALTRVFAILMWHHLSYMVISIAMLGLGASGTLLALRRDAVVEDESQRARVARRLALFSGLYGVAVVGALLLTSGATIDTLALWEEKSNFLRLGFVYVVLVVPFFLGGLVVGISLTQLVAWVNRLYFSDLLGSAIGACLSVWLLARLGPAGTVVAAAATAMVGSACFALAAGGRAALATLPGLAAAFVAMVGVSGGAVGIPEWSLHVKLAPRKELTPFEDRIEKRIYSSTAEVEVATSGGLPPIAGGDFGEVDSSWITGRFVGQDGSAPTALYKDGAQLDKYPFLDDSQTAAAYVAYRARGGQSPETLIIGVGGGIDVMIALAHDARRVVAVEVNQAMIDMVTTEFGDYLGGLFLPGAHPLSDRIQLVRGEGRSFARGSDDRFDVILMAGADSFTALSTGAYTLAESYLYTTGAVEDFYQRLKEDGYLSYSRFMMTAPKKPRETLRLVHIAATALRDMGIEEPEAQILVLQGKFWASTLIKRGRFSEIEVEALRAFGEREGFAGLVYDPLAKARGGPPRRGTRVAPQVRADFATLLQGSEEERAAFVETYEYDVTPSTDDAPFFFNYHRYGGLIDRLFSHGHRELHRYFPDFPVGHLVLIASLVQVTVLGTLLILLPIRRLAPRISIDREAAGPVFGYFAALGAGFMFLEIALMQKMILFLGHPTYAVTVVLATLLAFAGLGSLASERIGAVTAGVILRVVLVILALVAVTTAGVAWLLPELIGLSLAARVLVSVVFLAPIALVLGMPFPLGMRILRERCPDLLPWAWSINAFLSVFSSILCIMLAMAIGFSNVLWLSAAIYAAGLLGMSAWIGRSPEAGPATD